MVLNTDGITTETGRAYKPEVNSEQTLDKLGNMLTAYAKGVELKVNGEVIGFVKDQETADQILQQVQSKYIPASAVRSSLKTKSVSANSSKRITGQAQR